jgi:two-component system NtrC family sensor kinase
VPTEVHILVVDDDELLGRAVKRMLMPYRVTLAYGGGEALEEVAERDFDLILCDVMMPEISGPEFYHRLADVRPELQPRVLFMTGGALDRIQPMLRDVPKRLVEKPFTRRELLKVVDEYLEKLA